MTPGTVPPWRRTGPSQADLSPQRTAVNEAAGRARGLWLGYIALLAYLFITIGAVTHRDLLLQSPVTLPVLNVALPLVGFSAVAPVFFLINHFYLLLNLFGLSSRIGDYNAAVSAAGLADKPERIERRRLDTFVIVQMLGGTEEERQGPTSRFLQAIAWITLVIAPVLLLVFLQLQFLPYQSEALTWVHRLALLTDLTLIWIFWPAIRKHRWDRQERSFPARAAMLCVILFTCFLATFPGEFADGGSNARAWQTHRDSHLWWAKGPLFGTIAPGAGDAHQPGLPFLSRALMLTDDRTLIDHDAFDKIRGRYKADGEDLDPWDQRQKPWQSQRTRSFRDRNLRGADFARADLRNTDFQGARLQGASLDEASLQGASLVRTSLQGASLDSASLQGGSLLSASLQGASLSSISLQGVSLYSSNLQGASLDGASLQGASLVNANLNGASLNSASLQGTLLVNANLQGASLRNASLQGASLDSARLQGASLVLAQLQGASLVRASLQGGSLDRARLEGASLDGASLQAASLDGASLKAASLVRANLQGASLVGTSLKGASLENMFLWRTTGAPTDSDPRTIRIRTSNFAELDVEGYNHLTSDALAGVEDEETRVRIKARLSGICVIAKGCPDPRPDWLEPVFWQTKSVRRDDIQYINTIVEQFRSLACTPEELEASAPHIAEGLIRFIGLDSAARLEAVGPAHLPGLARHLLDAAEGRRDDCPGVKGLSEEAKERLREWAGSGAAK